MKSDCADLAGTANTSAMQTVQRAMPHRAGRPVAERFGRVIWVIVVAVALQ